MSVFKVFNIKIPGTKLRSVLHAMVRKVLFGMSTQLSTLWSTL